MATTNYIKEFLDFYGFEDCTGTLVRLDQYSKVFDEMNLPKECLLKVFLCNEITRNHDFVVDSFPIMRTFTHLVDPTLLHLDPQYGRWFRYSTLKVPRHVARNYIYFVQHITHRKPHPVDFHDEIQRVVLLLLEPFDWCHDFIQETYMCDLDWFERYEYGAGYALPQMRGDHFTDHTLVPKATCRDKKYDKVKSIMNLVKLNQKKRERILDKARKDKYWAIPQMSNLVLHKDPLYLYMMKFLENHHARNSDFLKDIVARYCEQTKDFHFDFECHLKVFLRFMLQKYDNFIIRVFPFMVKYTNEVKTHMTSYLRKGSYYRVGFNYSTDRELEAYLYFTNYRQYRFVNGTIALDYDITGLFLEPIVHEEEIIYEMITGNLDWIEKYESIPVWASPQMGILDIGLDDETAEIAADGINALNTFTSVLNRFSEKDAMGEFSKNISKLNSILEGFEGGKLDSIVDDTINKIREEVSDIANVLTNDVKSKAKKLALLTLAGSTIVYYYLKPCKERLIGIGLSFGFIFTTTNLFKENFLLKWVFHFFSNFKLFDEDKAQPQMFTPEDMDFGVNAVTTLLMAYFSFFTGKNVPKDLFMGLSNFGRVKLSLRDIISTIMAVVETVINWLRVELFDQPSIRFMESNKVEVNNYLEHVKSVLDSNDRGTYLMNDENYVQLEALITIGKKFATKMGLDRSNNGFDKLLWRDINALEKIKTHFAKSNYTLRGSRQESVACLLGGPPGVGKSIAMEAIAYALCAALLEPKKFEEFQKNPSSFFHNRQFENEYWDGYSNQFITFLDDFGQSTDVAGSPDNENFNIIRGVNGFEYTLHMSDIQDKGITIFNSSFMLVTTNRRKFDPKSIFSKEALDRRFAVRVVVAPKSEFRTKEQKDYWTMEFDKTKLPTAFIEVNGVKREVSTFTPEQVVFVDYDGDGNICGPEQTIDVIVSRLVKEYYKRRDWRIFQKTYFEKVATKYRSLYTADKQMGMQLFNKMEIKDVEYINEIEMFETCEISNNFITRADIITEGIRLFSYEDMNARINVKTLCSMMFRNINPNNYNFVVVWMNVIHKSPFNFQIEQKDEEKRVHQFIFRTFFYFKNNPLPFDKDDFILPSPKVVYTPAATYNEYFKNIYAAAKERDVSGILELTAHFILQRRELLMFASVVVSAVTIKTMDWLAQAIYMLVKHVFGKAEQPPAFPHSFGHSDKLGSKSSHKSLKAKGHDIKAKISAIRAKSQMSGHVDSSGSELIKSIVHSNMYVFSIEQEEGGVFKLGGQLLFLCDRIAILRYHYITTFAAFVEEDPSKAFAKIKISRSHKGREFSFFVTVADILEGHEVGELVHNDGVLVKFPKHVPIHRNVIKNFALRKDFEHHKNNIPVMMPIVRMDTDVEYMLLNAFAQDRPLPVGDTHGDYFVRDYYAYTAGTGDGDCGGLMCILNSKIPERKIFGIHSAGHPHLGYGYAAATCQEELLEDLKMFGPIIEEEELKVIPNCDIQFYPGTFKVLGTVNPAPQRIGKTDIKKSRLHNTYFKALTAPAKLKPRFKKGEMVPGTNPTEKAILKLNKVIPYIDQGILDDITHMYYADMLQQEKHPVDKRLLDWDEIFFGILDEADANRVNPKSSAGYPMNCKGNKNYKKEIFDHPRDSPEFWKAWEALKAICIEFEKLYLAHIRPFWLGTDNVKDERRPLAKVLEALSRLFTGCPVAYLIIWRRYYGSFHIYFHKNRIYNGSAIGVNPFSIEWDFIVRELSRVDITLTRIGAGDYASYDTSQGTQLHNCGLTIVNMWYNDEWSIVREILYLELTNSRHVCETVVYEMNYGLPSGHPFTPIINTIVGHIAMRYCWYRLVGVHQTFVIYVVLIQCGDDHIFSVHEKYENIFNEMTIIDKMAELGLTYTTETKTTAVNAFRSITDVEFLKRSFRWENSKQRYLAPLRLTVVLEIPCWTKIKEKPDEIVADNVATSIRELSLHDKDTFEKWKREILDTFYKKYPQLKFNQPLELPYHMMQAIVIDSDAYFRG